jgi:hypothetical protein
VLEGYHASVAATENDFDLVFAGLARRKEPFPFDEVFARATRADLGENHVTVASVADLIELKRRADRPKDREDIARLIALTEGGKLG